LGWVGSVKLAGEEEKEKKNRKMQTYPDSRNDMFIIYMEYYNKFQYQKMIKQKSHIYYTIA